MYVIYVKVYYLSTYIQLKTTWDLYCCQRSIKHSIYAACDIGQSVDAVFVLLVYMAFSFGSFIPKSSSFFILFCCN